MDCNNCGAMFSGRYEDGDKPNFDYEGWLELEDDDIITIWNYTEVGCEHGCCVNVNCVGCGQTIDTAESFVVRLQSDRCTCHTDGTKNKCDWWDATETQIEILNREPGKIYHKGV